MDNSEVLGTTPIASELQNDENNYLVQTDNIVGDNGKQEEEGYECSIS